MDENEQIHEKLVRHISVEQDRGHGKQHQTVQYIDYKNPENNDFFALNQFRVEGPVEVIKPDILLFVNGIPLGVVECKSPQIPEPKSEALDQLTRYQNERNGESEGAEELFRYNQFSVAAWMEGAVTGTYRTPKDQCKPWRDAYPLEDDEFIDLFDLDGYLPDQYRMLYALFEPERLLDQLRHYTVFEERQSETTKMVARYQQYRAVRKALERIDKRGQTVVPYSIDWSENRETMSLSIDESLELTVTAPMSATVADVESVLDSRQEWILEKLYGLKEQEGPPYPKEYLSGAKLRYRGRQYPLEVVEADVPQPELSFDEQTFTLRVHRFDADVDEVSVRRKRQGVIDWVVNRAEEELPERASRFESKLGLRDAPVEVGELGGRWGEYDDGTVRLNWRLVRAPVRIQDYVFVHELAHSVHEEHSDSFWNTVGALIPDYEDRREWLRVNGNILTV